MQLKQLILHPTEGMAPKGFHPIQIESSVRECDKMIQFYLEMVEPSRHKVGLSAPIWASPRVDCDIDDLLPLPGWVALQEIYKPMVATEYLHTSERGNTVYGTVVNASSSNDLGIAPGDNVVYREFHGGRWDCSGDIVLIIQEEHILAKVV